VPTATTRRLTYTRLSPSSSGFPFGLCNARSGGSRPALPRRPIGLHRQSWATLPVA